MNRALTASAVGAGAECWFTAVCQGIGSLRDGWNMSIEVGAMIVDSITAISAVVGVVIAARLGHKAVQVARETVDRSERDYAASRADMVGDAYAKVVHAMADVKADLHIFWKEDFQELKAGSPDSPRVHEIEDRNNSAEVEVHRAIYRLDSACVGLSNAISALSLNLNSVQIPASGDVDKACAAIHLYYGSAFPHYLTLLSDDKKKVPGPLKAQAKFIDWFLCQLRLDAADTESKNLEVKAASWLENYLLTEEGSQIAAEIIAVNFISSFALPELDAALDALVKPILNVCRPVIIDRLSGKASDSAQLLAV